MRQKHIAEGELTTNTRGRGKGKRRSRGGNRGNAIGREERTGENRYTAGTLLTMGDKTPGAR